MSYRYIGRSKPSFIPGIIACKGCKYLRYHDFICIGMDLRVSEIGDCPLGGISVPRKRIREWKPTSGLIPQKALYIPESCAEAE